MCFVTTTCVVTKVSLLQQSYVCHDKYLLQQKVTTSILLSREKTCFVTTKRLSWKKKMILVAVPANDSIIHEIWENRSAACLFLAGRHEIWENRSAVCLFPAGRHSADAGLISIFSLCRMRKTSKKRNSWSYRNLSMKRSRRYVWQLASVSTFFTAACICQVFTLSLSCHLNPNVPSSLFLFCSLPTLSLSLPPSLFRSLAIVNMMFFWVYILFSMYLFFAWGLDVNLKKVL